MGINRPATVRSFVASTGGVRRRRGGVMRGI
jgi:hypothetical protein